MMKIRLNYLRRLILIGQPNMTTPKNAAPISFTLLIHPLSTTINTNKLLLFFNFFNSDF